MNIIQSIVTSSADAKSVSLFVKSIVTFAVLFGLDVSVANEAGGYLINTITGLGMVLSSFTGLYGLGRKVVLGKWHA